MRLGELLERLLGVGRRSARGDKTVESLDGENFDDVDPFDPFPEPVRLEIKDVFDLHSVPPREVRAVVEEYLREARRLGFRSVRIIHGKGVGVQREAVRAVLARTPFVEHFADAPPEAGGWGATVAHLSVES
ncbi:MAG TPA: Smr/MutS family protein [Pyrinomonadaceae bacterium]